MLLRSKAARLAKNTDANAGSDDAWFRRSFRAMVAQGYEAINDNDDRNFTNESVIRQVDSNFEQINSTVQDIADMVLLDILYYQLKISDDNTDNLISYNVSNGSNNSYNFNSLRRLSAPVGTPSRAILSVSGNRFETSDLPDNFGLPGMLKEDYTIQDLTNENELLNYRLKFTMLYNDEGSGNVTEGGKTVNGLVLLNCGKYNLKFHTVEKITVTFNDDELKTREIKLYGHKKDPIKSITERERDRYLPLDMVGKALTETVEAIPKKGTAQEIPGAGGEKIPDYDNQLDNL